MQRWEHRETYLLDEARRELEDGGHVRPGLLAVAGERPLLTAFLRDVEPGRLVDALIEVVALAAPLGADRLALSLPGRAWSLDDPLPPVVPGLGDLRQPLIVVQEVDGSAGPPRERSGAFPYDLVDGKVRWGPPLRQPGTIGLLAATLLIAVRDRDRLRATDGELRTQARRCVKRGHLVAFSEPVYDRLVGGR